MVGERSAYEPEDLMNFVEECPFAIVRTTRNVCSATRWCSPIALIPYRYFAYVDQFSLCSIGAPPVELHALTNLVYSS